MSSKQPGRHQDHGNSNNGINGATSHAPREAACDIRKYPFDINETCELLLQFAAGKTFSDYSSDPILRSAVERQYQSCYPPKGRAYLDERTEQGMSGKENTLLPMPDPMLQLSGWTFRTGSDTDSELRWPPFGPSINYSKL